MKLKISKALTILRILEQMEWKPGVVNSDGKEIKSPFPFTGRVRLRMARNIRRCRDIHDQMEEVRVKLVKQLGGEDTPLDADKERQFQKEMQKALSEEVDVDIHTIDLFTNYSGERDDVICLTRCPLPSELVSHLLDIVLIPQEDAVK
jgi:hypothetical protein